jgi:hypothetical protein
MSAGIAVTLPGQGIEFHLLFSSLLTFLMDKAYFIAGGYCHLLSSL